ncbi:MAG TPA: hypothetical protein VN285_05540 [Candidatus Deferrimicrobium sp.]|nr:hypothetical protein [Candidatus Deferrimicrobium sp.]
MKYLSYDRMDEFVRRYFGSSAHAQARLVGVDRSHDSGYFDIVRLFGHNAVDPSRVQVEYMPDEFEFGDAVIAEYAQETELLLRAETRLHSGPSVMKLVDADFESRPYRVVVQECSYGAQAGSCFALDFEHHLFRGCGENLREYYKRKYPSQRVRDNPLAICLGVCGIVLLQEGRSHSLLRVFRSDKLASLEDSEGPSVAGGVDFMLEYTNLSDLIEQSLVQEIKEELGLERHEYDIVPLAYAREIFRGERPQLFCFVSTDLTRETIARRLTDTDYRWPEQRGFAFADLKADGRLPTEVVAAMNHEARMNYFLLEEYFDLKSKA